MKPVVILGSGSHAMCVIDLMQDIGGFEIAGCIADDTDPTRTVLGVPIIGRAARIERLAGEGYRVAIGLGSWNRVGGRQRLFDQADQLGLEIVTIVHPRARVATSASVGRGSLIFPFVDIAPGATLGDNVMVGTGSFVSHESHVGDHALISGGVAIGGRVHIGSSTVVALGATIVTDVSIGTGCLIAAGATVVADVADRSVVRSGRTPKR